MRLIAKGVLNMRILMVMDNINPMKIVIILIGIESGIL